MESLRVATARVDVYLVLLGIEVVGVRGLDMTPVRAVYGPCNQLSPLPLSAPHAA